VIHIEANKRCLPKGVCVKGTTSHPITVMSKIQKIVENKRGNQKRKRKRELADEHHETSTNAPYQYLLIKYNAEVLKNRELDKENKELVEKNRELAKENKELVKKNKELVDDKNRELKTNQNNVQQLNSSLDVGQLDAFSPSSSSGPFLHNAHSPRGSLLLSQLPSSIESLWYNADSSL